MNSTGPREFGSNARVGLAGNRTRNQQEAPHGTPDHRFGPRPARRSRSGPAPLPGSTRRKATPSIVVSRRLAAPSPSLINMASIKIEGIGGLGMVAAVVAVAVSDPRIRLATLIAATLGLGLALVLIAMRRHTGALPSSGDGPEDRSTLHLDTERRRSSLSPACGRQSTTFNTPGRADARSRRDLDTSGGLAGVGSGSRVAANGGDVGRHATTRAASSPDPSPPRARPGRGRRPETPRRAPLAPPRTRRCRAA